MMQIFPPNFSREGQPDLPRLSYDLLPACVGGKKYSVDYQLAYRLHSVLQKRADCKTACAAEDTLRILAQSPGLDLARAILYLENIQYIYNAKLYKKLRRCKSKCW